MKSRSLKLKRTDWSSLSAYVCETSMKIRIGMIPNATSCTVLISMSRRPSSSSSFRCVSACLTTGINGSLSSVGLHVGCMNHSRHR